MAPGDLPQSSTYVQSPKAAAFTPLTSLTYTYDADGNLKQVDDAMGQRTIYDYNAVDELTGTEQGTVSGGVYTQARSASFTYDPDGNLLTITRYTTGITTPDVVSTYGYDATGQITSLAHTHTQSAADVIILANYTWTYDAAGNSTSQTLTTADTMTMGSSGLLQGPVVDDTSTYSYDAADQLTGDSLNGESYSYDGNGNRTSDTITSGNRMASDGTYNYTYDANGNCVSRTTISSVGSSQYITLYTWDYRNRLVEVQYETSAGQLTETINYSYDYLNRRIEKITLPSGSAADHSYLAYQGNQPYAQFDSGTAAITHSAAAGDETDWYMQAAAVDQVLSDYQPNSYGETLWLLPDNQGTIRDLAADMNFGTQSTFVIIHRNFDAFGNITSVQCNITFPFTITTAIGYCGGIYDPDLNMVQFVDRWYDPAAGRWLTPDPRGFAGGLSNLYCYCGNNPLNERDPTGLCGYSGSGVTYASGGAVSIEPSVVAEASQILGGIGSGVATAPVIVNNPDGTLNLTTSGLATLGGSLGNGNGSGGAGDVMAVATTQTGPGYNIGGQGLPYSVQTAPSISALLAGTGVGLSIGSSRLTILPSFGDLQGGGSWLMTTDQYNYYSKASDMWGRLGPGGGQIMTSSAADE